MKRLAELCDLTPRSITAFESGAMPAMDTTIQALADALDFPVSFLCAAEVEEPLALGASFRALTAMTASERDAALASGIIAMELSRWIEGKFTLPNVDVPDAREFEPEAAAAVLRRQWGIGERPIKNMVHLLESKGVRVFSLPAESANVDAFSLWRHDVPFVFLNTLKSGEHGRFDAAHELGHLVLHRHGSPRGREAEAEADRFSSAFLMPEASVRACAPRAPSLNLLIRLKRTWKVSVAALAYRLRSLGLLTEWHYRTLCIQIGERGYRKSEPEGIHRETSQVLTKVLGAMRAEGTTKTAIARDLHVKVEDLDAVIFGLVMLGVQGGRPDKPTPRAKTSTPHLREA